jgi:hypothetical protein
MTQLLALSAKSRLGWKLLILTNTLAYYEALLITAVKGFIVLDSWLTPTVIKAETYFIKLCKALP